MQPNYVIIGPPKCASSSLHYYLSQHPQIFASKTKEVEFFTLNYHKGKKFYEQNFQDAINEIAVGESTPTYSVLPYVADRIKESYPHMKLILCLRNPIDRTYSSWLMQQGMEVEKFTLRQVMEINKKQLEYISLEGEQGAETWIDAQKITKAMDENGLRIEIQAGSYAAILESYLKRFPASQIKVIFVDDLKKDFDKTMSGLFSFLNVDSSFIIPDKKIVNFQFDRKLNKVANKFIGIKNTKYLAKFIVPKFIKDKLKSSLKNEPPKISFEDRLYLWEFFKDDISKLEKMTGKNLSHWNPNNQLQETA